MEVEGQAVLLDLLSVWAPMSKVFPGKNSHTPPHTTTTTAATTTATTTVASATVATIVTASASEEVSDGEWTVVKGR